MVIRLLVAMALMPDASYFQTLARLAGLLADIPFAREWHVPAEKVVTAWPVLVSADLTEALFWRAAGPLCRHRTKSRIASRNIAEVISFQRDAVAQ